ncbi:MAG: hypothetical protein V7754_17045 [Halioglobus sp.]
MEALRQLLLPFYLEVKTAHLLAVGMWSFSTAVAFRDYLVPAFRAWLRTPDDADCIARRNDAMERFDRGAQLEHWAFPLVLITGIMMVWLANWPIQEISWLSAKLALILIIFIPMEIIDYHISHFGGNKTKIKARGGPLEYEKMILWHWQFFRVTTPIVVTLIPLTFYLAVSKPF